MAYLKITPTPELEQEQAALERAPAAERAQRLAVLNESLSESARPVLRNTATGSERAIDTASLRTFAPAVAVDGTVLFAGAAGPEPMQIYAATAGGAPRPLTDGPGDKSLLELNSTGTAALVTIRGASGWPWSIGQERLRTLDFSRCLMDSGPIIPGSSPSFSADGRSFAFVVRSGGEWQLLVV